MDHKLLEVEFIETPVERKYKIEKKLDKNTDTDRLAQLALDAAIEHVGHDEVEVIECGIWG